MRSLHAELAARPHSRADFARLAAGWLTDARHRLFPDVHPGPPGAASAWLRVQHQPEALGGTSAPYTDRAWRRMLAGLDRAYPFHVQGIGGRAGWAGSPGTQRTWARFVREQAVRAGAHYGHVTDDANTHGTALERAIHGVTDEPPAVPRCQAVLRGYSWVTICAAELAIRLGGAPALAASGAFDEVRELPGRPDPERASGMPARLVMDCDAGDFR